MFENLEGKYKPEDFEKQIYGFWLDRKLFHAEIDKDRTPFTIVIPPPNVTGYLHIGHALNNSLQDIVIRYKRMKGLNAAWIPGTDHAGIATQNVVERELNKQGKTRFDLGREGFVKKAWEWKEKYGNGIINQLKVLGCSCDWQRQRFTFDDAYVRAVTREFVTLYEQGLIYRGKYMVNWCPRCLTAISDIEVEHSEKDAKLWDIKYPLIDEKTSKPSEEEYLIVSTTRPETMLGDTAVAVNPQDDRYSETVGKKVYLPLVGRVIPVIKDDYVDKDFGTGAVKVTPAHDPNDFLMGKRHDLEQVDIMKDDAVMNENAGPYEGLSREQARKKVLQDLEAKGYLIGEKKHLSSVGYCSRCETVIEPRISLQWFVAMKELAKPAIKAVRDRQVKIIPSKWEKIYFNWMENIRDWCISRQLWWGHRIPVYYCKECQEMIVSETRPDACGRCGGAVEQDDDVLDTWFSSCLWPFATQGWPEKTAELKYFFPTDVLITAHDIIFFWVARMIMMSLHFMGEVPFKEVFINPLVTDPSGQKMSKSKGNVIDPLEIISESGTDVLRYTLASLTTPGRNLHLGPEKIEGTRNFANKIWNAAKFVLSNIGPFLESGIFDNIDKSSFTELDLNIWDRWILSRLSKTLKSVERHLKGYNFAAASRLMHDFFWDDYCDWYLESSKVRLYSDEDEGSKDKETVAIVLWYVLENYLRAFHPFMPFLTERIWQCIPHKGESIMVQPFPSSVKKPSLSPEGINTVFKVISEIRKIRSELNINPSSKVKVSLHTTDGDTKTLLGDQAGFMKGMAKLSAIDFKRPKDMTGYVKSVTKKVDIYIYILDAIDVELEKKRIEQEIDKIAGEQQKSKKKIANPQFIEKAPKQVVDKEKKKLEEFTDSLKVLKEQLKRISGLTG